MNYKTIAGSVVVLAIAASLGIWVRGSARRTAGHPARVYHASARLPLAADKKTIRVPVPVFTYHYVRKDEDPRDRLGYDLSVTPENFEEQMAYVAGHYTTMTPHDLFLAMSEKETLPKRAVILTFDDGYADFYTAAFPILKKYNLKATAFIVPGFLSEADGRYMSWQQVKDLDASGLITIGAHTMHHVDLVGKSKEAKQEIYGSKQALEKFLGHEVETFAYPYGYFDAHTMELVNASGFETAFTTRYGLHHEYQKRFELPRVRISGGMDLEKFKKRLSGD